MATQIQTSLRKSAAPARLAVLTVALTQADTPAGVQAGQIQVFPAGAFRSADGSGRPDDVDAWRMDAAIAHSLIETFEAKGRSIVIDYEHQTLAAGSNGQPAPAAGWIRGLEWRDGKGLYAQVEWTARARDYIAAGEYRYISPVFPYDRTGRPLDILHVALTNDPALAGMDEVRLAAMSRLAALQGDFLQPMGDVMGDLLKALYALLELPEDAAEDEALAALAQLADKLKATEARVEELTGEQEKRDGEIAALKAQTHSKTRPDPTKWVPAQALAELQKQVNALGAAHVTREVDEVVTAALTAKKLTPALEAWARELGRKDIAALRAYVGAAAPIAALAGHQTAGLGANVKVGDRTVSLDDTELAVCRAMGLNPEAWAKNQTQQQATQTGA